jgi:dipeptidase D
MRVIELFKQITSIPRCSNTHIPFINFTKQFASKYNYNCTIDIANNILISKKNGNPKLCLQSHYDIVCLEGNKIPIIIEEDGYLKATDSTLGADNGIGCAYMFALIEDDEDVECLFTCDEEIGLVGANNINLDLKSIFMLNLDSETQGEICIGCAGGIDILAKNDKSEIIHNMENKDLYEITIDNLDGGHSGIDIDKNIPNALKLITKSIKECNGELLDINGGERINSIPKSAKAIIVSNNIPQQTHKNMKINKIITKTKHYTKLHDNITNFLYSFSSGVRAYNKELDVVLNSINLAIISNNHNCLTIELSARSMDNKQLNNLVLETISLLEYFEFDTSSSGKYPAWKPEHSNFTNKILKIYKKYDEKVSLKAIHAGLECAIFKNKYPNIQICSIGPNIYFPHSNREKCEINSVITLYKIIKNIVKNI